MAFFNFIVVVLSLVVADGYGAQNQEGYRTGNYQQQVGYGNGQYGSGNSKGSNGHGNGQGHGKGSSHDNRNNNYNNGRNNGYSNGYTLLQACYDYYGSVFNRYQSQGYGQGSWNSYASQSPWCNSYRTNGYSYSSQIPACPSGCPTISDYCTNQNGIYYNN